MIGSDNNGQFSSCSPLPKILNDYPHKAVIDSKNILMSKYFTIYCFVSFEKKKLLFFLYLL